MTRFYRFAFAEARSRASRDRKRAKHFAYFVFGKHHACGGDGYAVCTAL